MALRLLILVAVLAVNCQSVLAAGTPLPVPSLTEHRDFLLNDWKSDRPSLIVFVDPYCPYCLKALEKRRRWDNYNVFLFWAPVLGDASTSKVYEIFACASPIGASLLDTVIARQPLGCSDKINEPSLLLNEKMVNAYSPRYVPQYWLGGQIIHTAQLNLRNDEFDLATIVRKSPLKVDWPRYRSHALNRPTARRYNLAVIVPDKFTENVALAQLLSQDNKYNWYLFPNSISSKLRTEYWCEQNEGECDDSPKQSTAGSEFRMLTGLEDALAPILMLEGRILSEREKAALLPDIIQQGFSKLMKGADATSF